MNQFACHFCSLCDQLEATIKTPDNARRVHISVNCTPDQASRRSELKLEVSEKLEKRMNPILIASITVRTEGAEGDGCVLQPIGVDPNQDLDIKLNTGLLQQCQIVATSFDRLD